MFNRCSLEHMRKSELIDLIIAMCGKQIPKQPHYYKENPHCKCGYVITAGDDYCRKCGVRIDWSE